MHVLGTLLIAATLPAHASISTDDLTRLSLEELGDIRITSVSKKAERVADAAASVYVITADDIRRSGARSLPEALRLAPNLHVARASDAGYAISARGMNGSNTSAPNKLLVLVDGRSVYTPLFSGVFWDVQDVVMEDIERIEVISGPGGTLWGVNAVNGVINIITRAAGDTQGTLVAATAGNRGSDAVLQHGGPLGESGHYRVYGKYVERDHTRTESGIAVDDAGHRSQAGFRIDWAQPGDRFSVSGNVYDGSEGQPAPGAISIAGVPLELGDVSLSGANLIARWDRQFDGGSSLGLQAYYDRTERTVPPTFGQKLDIIDLQLQHSLRRMGVHSVAWGANFRQSRDRVDNSPYFAFIPAHVDQQWTSLFVQDEMALRDNLRFTLGTRLERNDYTGTEILPNARIAWRFAPDHMLWSAVSRAVRAPSRLDHDSFIPGAPPFLLNGGRDVRSELATVYELGYRGLAASRFSYSVTAFHTEYDDLRTTEIDPGFTFLLFGNGMEGRATGIEMWGTYQAAPAWRLSGGFTALRETLWLKPGSDDVDGPNAAGFDPSNTWQLRSSWSIGDRHDFDLGVRHVAALDRNDIPAYTALDARFGWRLAGAVELSIAGTNLLGRHSEYGALATRSEFGPEVWVSLLWKM
jgi:iron complex outermembrane receptor protein